MKVPPPTDTTLWAAIGEFAVAVVTVLGAAWVAAVTILRPLFEAQVFRALRSKRSELGDLLRSDVLKSDLDAANVTAKKIERLVLVAESNAKLVEELAGRHDVLDRELRSLPALARSLETCTRAVETLSRDVGTLSGRIERYGGMFDQLQKDREA